MSAQPAVQYSVQFFGLPSHEYVPLARRAEQLGFEAVWLADHVITPVAYAKNYPYNATGDPAYRADTPLTDVAVTLGCLAGATERIRLATGVFVLPLRNPFHVARAFAAVHNLSQGRLIFGVGTGWMAEEFEVIGEQFERRGARTDEMIDVLNALWGAGPAEFSGQFYRFPPVHFSERPTAPIPLVFGGHSAPALRRAARVGSGWFGPQVSLDCTRELTAHIDEHRKRLGRDEPFTHYVRLVGELSQTTIDRYRATGYSHLVFSPFNRPDVTPTLEGRLAALDRAAAVLGLDPS